MIHFKPVGGMNPAQLQPLDHQTTIPVYHQRNINEIGRLPTQEADGEKIWPWDETPRDRNMKL